MPLTRLHLENFTAFEMLDLELSAGINIFIGVNSTGKTHILKALYAACDITTNMNAANFADKINKVFGPSNLKLGRIVKRKRGRNNCVIKITSDKNCINTIFSSKDNDVKKVNTDGENLWRMDKIESVFIPAKEVLSLAPGMNELYNRREINIDETIVDVINRASLPPLRGPKPEFVNNLIRLFEEFFPGHIVIENDEFFLVTNKGKFEFNLVAEGYRKLGLLLNLIQNGIILKGSILFWDEPEANLNPAMYKNLIKILLELQRNGVQIFLATHNFAILKEFDLQMKDTDKLLFHALYRDKETKEILCNSTPEFLQIEPNAILEASDDIYNREVIRSIKGIDK